MRAQLLTTATLLTAVTAIVSFPRSVLNGVCTGANDATGVCIYTASCKEDGGTYIDNACPGTPGDIKCCTKPQCQHEAKKGDCRWVDKCTGGKEILQNQCPGPDAFRCCITNGEGPSLSVSKSSGQPTLTKSATASANGSGTAKTSVLAKTDSSVKPTESATDKTSVQPSATFSKASEKPTSKVTTTPDGTNLGEKILKKAKEAEGIQYHWAGGSCKGTTGGGFDCSGLVSWAVCQVTGRDLFSEGLRVTRTMYCASEQTLKYDKIKWADRRGGDAVFFGGKCDCEKNPKAIHHVGLMLDDGYTMFNALKTGTKIRTDNFKNWSEPACPYVIRFK